MAGLSGLGKLFKKKNTDDEFDEDFDFDDDIDDAPSSASSDAPDTSAAPEAAQEATPDGAEEGAGSDGVVPAVVEDDVDIDDVDFGDFDEDDDDDHPHSRRPVYIAIAGAVVLLAGIAGGAGWWYFSGDDESQKPAAGKAASEHKGPMAGMALPPRPGQAVRGGGLNKFTGLSSKGTSSTGTASKGAMTPSAPRNSAFGKPTPTDQTGEPGKTATGASSGASLARTVGDISGRFGGRADPLSGSLNVIGDKTKDTGAGVVVPSVTSVTLRTLPDFPGGRPLGPTPDARLIEKKEGLTGALPITGKDGSVSWKVYARPYEGENQGKRVAIVVMDLGLSRASSRAAIGKLPGDVTLALNPYARDLSDWLVRARLVGHEVLMMLPMESERFPVQDAGPLSLDTALKEEDNIKRLELLLSQVTGYIGVATSMGSRFGTSDALMTSVLKILKDRGLMLLTSGVQSTLLGPKIARKIGLPLVVGDIILDEEPSRAGIDAKLQRLEEMLKERSTAVAIAQPYPATIARLIAWIKTLKGKKITLVPVSALVKTESAE
ncbi:MAG: divergent polysaccharide deacetylase family protein [Rhodospirillales bacterium]|nr:divergent polysaccharide deacetylase family protein [Rhodospirillales bacterium]